MDKELKEMLKVHFETLSEYYNSDGEYEIDDSGCIMINVSMTDECDTKRLSVDSFLDYMSDLRTLRRVDKTTVRTKHIRQTVIDTTNHGSEYIALLLSKYVYVGQNFEVNVVNNPFLVGLYNAKEINCDDNYMIWPCSGYLAIEIKYLNDSRLAKQDEDLVIRRVLYDLTKKVGVAVFVSEILDVNELADEAELEYSVSSVHITKTTIDINTLPKSIEMLDLYRQAKEILNSKLAFLHYYKIIEYVSPAVAKKKAIEKITIQINQPSTVARDYHYMNNILNIASQYRDDQKDDSLMKIVIEECLDLKPELIHIPDSLIKQIRNNIGIAEGVDLTAVLLDDNKESSLIKQVASIIYSTRNSIVHAKSNYMETGWECPKDSLPELNKMMDTFALKMIEWNEAQPENIKV